VNKLIAKLSLIPGTNLCAEDFAIDDFIVKPLGPEVNIHFENEPASTIVKTTCFQHNTTVSMGGTVAPYYNNAAMQWQQSINNGASWQDIPGAVNAIYTRTFSSPGTFLFRLTAAEAANITNPNCRVASKYLTVECDDVPQNYRVTSNAPFCVGRQLQLNASGGARYEWRGPNGFYENVASPQIFNTKLSDSGMYYAEIISAGGCSIKDSTRVIIYGTDVQATGDTAICLGATAQLKASSGVVYHWSPETGLSGPTLFNPKATPTATTVYTVSVTDRSGCTDTAKVTVKIINNIKVKAGIEANGYICRPYDSLRFADNSQGKITNWQWNFSNGQTDTSKQPATQYYSVMLSQNSLMVRLAIKDTAGCTDTAYHLLRIVDNCYISVPSAFTPNNDGVNDYLFPTNAYKATRLSFKIYNRLGQLVFKTNDWLKKWDGKYGNQPQPTDNYIWMLEYDDVNNKRIRLKGTTLLIR
jgi:gliding motility-associated-like protein